MHLSRAHRRHTAARGRHPRRRSRKGHDRMAYGERFLLGQFARREHGLVRADGLIVADRHRHAVGKQVGRADDQDGALGQLSARHTGDHRKRGDDAVVGAVDQLADVVPGAGEDAVRFDVSRGAIHLGLTPSRRQRPCGAASGEQPPSGHSCWNRRSRRSRRTCLRSGRATHARETSVRASQRRSGSQYGARRARDLRFACLHEAYGQR